MKYACLALLLAISLNACQPSDSPTVLANDDYRVYSDYINSFSFYKNDLPKHTITISDSTTMRPGDIHPETTWAWVIANLGDRCKYLNDMNSCRKAKDPAWSPLFERIKKPASVKQVLLLPSKFDVSCAVQLYSQFQKQLAKTRIESEPLTHYFFSLSKIAFNKEKAKALFFGSFVCGGLCGRGELIMMEKVDNNWKIIDTFRFWIA